jgi:polysaccharide export outer membrane protein
MLGPFTKVPGMSRQSTIWCVVIAATLFAGCRTAQHVAPPLQAVPPLSADVPKELSKVVLPLYTVEPPDILVVEAIHVVPKSPYLLRTGDLIAINVVGTLPDSPISGAFPIQPGGIVNLGAPYGTVKVTKMTTDEAQQAILTALAAHIKEPVVTVSLVEMSGKQQIAGQHLVGLDGTITLGSYGSVSVVGLTLAQTKEAIERHLSHELEDPSVAVDIFAYNSKVYYVITEGAGTGDAVTRFPITGNDTVLDAMANINGTTEVSSKKIWIARPVPDSAELEILPVDWQGITALGATSTNYQIFPGDRVFVSEDKRVALDTSLAKTFAPAERVMGFGTLSANIAGRMSGRVLQGGGLRGFFGGGGIN